MWTQQAQVATPERSGEIRAAAPVGHRRVSGIPPRPDAAIVETPRTEPYHSSMGAAPGWDAMDAALRPLVGDSQPL